MILCLAVFLIILVKSAINVVLANWHFSVTGNNAADDFDTLAKRLVCSGYGHRQTLKTPTVMIQFRRLSESIQL